MTRTVWDQRFLALAEHVASWSRDPSTKVGAVIVRPDKTIASVGFNGFPRGMSDDPELYANRELKYSRIVHAEINAILHTREALHGYTLYTWPLAPCDRCAVTVIQSGISRVVFPATSEEACQRWGKLLEVALGMFAEAGVEYSCLG